MPPRQRTRGASGTPTPRPTTRSNSQGTTAILEATPLPDVEAQPSFAYGSSNTKALPLKLVAEKRVSLRQMAENLDAGISAAQLNFDAQRAQAQQYGTSITQAQAQARANRASRRSVDRDSVASSSAHSDNSDNGSQRSRHSQQSSPEPEPQTTVLEDIREESKHSSEEESFGTTRLASRFGRGRPNSNRPIPSHMSWYSSSRITPRRDMSTPQAQPMHDASSMPSVSRLEQSYGEERDVPIVSNTSQQPNFLYRLWNNMWMYLILPVVVKLVRFSDYVGYYYGEFRLFMRDTKRAFYRSQCYRDLRYIRFSRFIQRFRQVLILLFHSAALTVVLMVFGYIICGFFCENPWADAAPGLMGQAAHGVCRILGRDLLAIGPRPGLPSPPHRGTSIAIAGMTSRISGITKRIIKHEKTMLEHEKTMADIESKYAKLSAQNKELSSSLVHAEVSAAKDMDSVKSGLKSVSATMSMSANRAGKTGAIAPPMLSLRVNYASPGSGAVIDPHMTSPTLIQRDDLMRRILLAVFNIQRRKSNNPIAALQPWSEIGDCWCAARTQHVEHTKEVYAAVTKMVVGTMDANAGRADHPTHSDLKEEAMRESRATYAQLGIKLGHDIYPDTIGIEHPHLSTSIRPRTAPKTIQIWADLSYMHKKEFSTEWVRTNSPMETMFLPKQMVMVGSFRYDAEKNIEHGETTQLFPLRVNRLMWDEGKERSRDLHTSKIVVRILDDWGNELSDSEACLYRVLVFGEPVTKHSEIVYQR